MNIIEPIRSKDRFIIFGAPLIEDAEIEEVIASMRSGWLGTGPKVANFEQDFRQFKGTLNAVAVNSCTAALHLSVLAAGIKLGDEVITTPLTFCATVNAIIHAGGSPVLADIDKRTMNIDPSQIISKITPATKAIVPVHFAGRPCDMDSILAIAKNYNLKVIEDCAHTVEAEYRGKKIGTMGDFGCFSFYVTKNIVTGEGGMVITNDDEAAARIKILALHGMSKDAWSRFSNEGYRHYQVVECGFKYNMMDLQAAIGLHQLKKVDLFWKRRAEIWQRYNEALSDLPLLLPLDPEEGTKHSFHLYTLQIDFVRSGISRDDFLNAMNVENIGVGVHYLSVPEHIYYQRKYGWNPLDFPQALEVGRNTVSLPISPKMTEEDVEDVISAVKKVILR